MELTLRHKLLIERGDGFTVMCELRKSPYNLKPGEARKLVRKHNAGLDHRRTQERINPQLMKYQADKKVPMSCPHCGNTVLSIWNMDENGDPICDECLKEAQSCEDAFFDHQDRMENEGVRQCHEEDDDTI